MKNYNIDDLASKDPKVKFPAAKYIRDFARENPSEVYPDLDRFIELLDGKGKVLLWNAVGTIGALASVDKERKIQGIRYENCLFERRKK